MDQQGLLREISQKSGYGMEETRIFYQALVTVLAETLGQGERLDCMPDWGRFIPKLRDNVSRNDNSPNRPQKPYHIIQFKPGKHFEEQLFSASCQDRADKEINIFMN